MDDVSIGGRTEAIFRTAERVRDVYEGQRLELNVRKCWILGPNVHHVADPPDGFELREDGGRALGRPIGSPEYQRQWVIDKVAERRIPLAALSRLPRRSQLAMTRLVFNPRFDYLAKTIPTEIARETLRAYDTQIDDALWNMGASYDRVELSTLRALPFHQGGLSIPRVVDIRSDRHRLVTRQRAADFLAHNLHSLSAVFSNPIIQQLYEGDEVLVLPGAEVGDEFADIDDIIKRTREQVRDEEDQRARALRARLMENGRQEHAARLLSASVKGASKWMTCSSAPGTLSSGFDDRAFLEALRCRLLSPFLPPDDQGGRVCACQRRTDLALHPTHPGTCSLTKGIALRRHDAVRNRLAVFLKTCNPTAVVTIEPTNVIPREGGEAARRPDIRFEKEGAVHSVDVAIVDPAAEVHLRHHEIPSHSIEGGAARQEEDQKLLLYRHTPLDGLVTPFVMESTGRLGSEAVSYLERYGNDAPSRRTV